MKRRIVLSLWMLVGACGFLFSWENLVLATLVSQSMQAFYNYLLAQQEPGVGTDLQILTVMGFGAYFSYAVAKCFLHPDNEMKCRGRHRLWLLVGTIAFVFLWESVSITLSFAVMVWQFYFDLIGPDNQWLASVLGLITAILIGFSLSCAIARLACIVIRRNASWKN